MAMTASRILRFSVLVRCFRSISIAFLSVWSTVLVAAVGEQQGESSSLASSESLLGDFPRGGVRKRELAGLKGPLGGSVRTVMASIVFLAFAGASGTSMMVVRRLVSTAGGCGSQGYVRFC